MILLVRLWRLHRLVRLLYRLLHLLLLLIILMVVVHLDTLSDNTVGGAEFHPVVDEVHGAGVGMSPASSTGSAERNK